jgi:hypothetical protein
VFRKKNILAGFFDNKHLVAPPASQIWELSRDRTNTMDFAEAVDGSDLEAFGFTDEFIFELWGVITDAKSGRLAAKKDDLVF